MATQPDFWGNLDVQTITTPVSILREQAALLGKKTKNVIEAQVDTDAAGGKFHHSFNLVVPTLDDYTYQLFAIRHEIDLYPVSVVWSGGGIALSTEQDFKDWVQATLSSSQTRRIITNLLSQVSR